MRERDDTGWQALKQSSAAPGLALVPATAALVLTLVFFPDLASLATHAYAVTLGVLVLWALARTVSRAFLSGAHSAVELALQSRLPAADTLGEIRQIEVDISVSGMSGFEYHFRLRRLLARLAAQRLAAHKSVDLNADPNTAKVLLGDQLWAAIAEDGRPADHDSPGMQIDEVKQLVEALELI